MDPDTIEISSPELNPEVQSEVLEEFPVLEEDISYDDFFRGYILTNVPCLIRIKSLTEGWKSLEDWAGPGGSKCNVDFFRQILAPNLKVPVADCGSKYFNSQEKLEMTLDEYLSYWNGRQTGDSDIRCLYLKDWHFRRDCPNYTGILFDLGCPTVIALSSRKLGLVTRLLCSRSLTSSYFLIH